MAKIFQIKGWRKIPLIKRLVSLFPFVLLAFLAFSILVPIAPHLQVVPSTDSSVFLYMGDRILEGAVPYRDVWDHKGPLIYYIDALGLVLGNGSRWGVWLLELAAIFAAASIAYVLLERVFAKGPAIFATPLFIIELRPVLDQGNLVEEYALPLQLLMLWLFWRAIRLRHWVNFFLMGVAAALCFLLRLNSIGISIAIGVYLAAQAVRERRRESWRSLAFSIAGGLTVLAMTALYFLSQQAFTLAWDQLFTFNIAYTAEEAGHWWDALLTGFTLLPLSTLFGITGWIMALATISVKKMFSSDVNPMVALAVIALPLEIALTVAPGREYPHYYMGWLPILGFFAAFLLHFLSLNFSPGEETLINRNQLVKILTLGFILSFALVPIIRLLPITQRTIEDGWQSGGLPPVDLTGHRYKPLLDYIDQNVPAQQPLLVWGNQATINWLTDRDAPNRFVYQTPLFLSGYWGREKTNEMIADLEANPPVMIDTGSSGGFLPSLGVRLEKVPQAVRSLYRYFQENFVYAGTFMPLEWDLYLYHGEGIPLAP